MITCAGCNVSPVNQQATPDFVTAVLPFTPIPASTPTIINIPPATASNEIAAPTNIPIEGTTTTQVNVRAEPSTASETLGMIGIFTKVQVTGKDASGSWYQVIYASGYGWVRAEYVQVDASAEIPLIGAGTGNGSAVSALVIQKINVRNGPAATFESLGALNPNDVVFITGKDPGGAWMQIEFAHAPEGTGWVAAEFLQAGNLDSVPTIGSAEESPTSVPTEVFPIAMDDGDSMQTPLAAIIFSQTNARALQLTGDISAPDGDTKDWIQFSSDGGMVAIRVTCSSNALQADLWKNEVLMDTFPLPCGNKLTITITSGEQYFLSLTELKSDETQYTRYVLNMETFR